MEHKSHEKQMREAGFFSLKKRRLRRVTLYTFLKGGGGQVGATESLLPGNK